MARIVWIILMSLIANAHHGPLTDDELAERELCELSLRNYVRFAWSEVEPATPFKGNWHIDAVCDHLAAVSAGQIRRLIIMMPPRHMKSLCMSVFWPSWDWGPGIGAGWGWAGELFNEQKRWAMLIQRIYQADPLLCPRCGGTMKIIAFIEARQGDLVRQILEHCGLWQDPPPPTAKAPPRSPLRPRRLARWSWLGMSKRSSP